MVDLSTDSVLAFKTPPTTIGRLPGSPGCKNSPFTFGKLSTKFLEPGQPTPSLSEWEHKLTLSNFGIAMDISLAKITYRVFWEICLIWKGDVVDKEFEKSLKWRQPLSSVSLFFGFLLSLAGIWSVLVKSMDPAQSPSDELEKISNILFGAFVFYVGKTMVGFGRKIDKPQKD